MNNQLALGFKNRIQPKKGKRERKSELESRKIISKCKANKFKKTISKRKEKQINTEREVI